MQVCDRVAEFSGAGWAQKGAQYSEARYGKRDMSYLFPYYEKAADMGWAEAEATVAYWRYMGFYCEQDKGEGERRFAALTSFLKHILQKPVVNTRLSKLQQLLLKQILFPKYHNLHSYPQQ